jgi:hypothetical protein
MGVDGSYPERHGEPDCAYYIRTGLCRFGSTCRFNHPHDRKLVIATARIKGEYPERIGQPECEVALFRITIIVMSSSYHIVSKLLFLLLCLCSFI